VYGPNALDVSIPTLRELLVKEAFSPVTVLKVLDLILSALDRGPPSVLLMSACQFIAFRYRCAHTVRSNLRRLREEVVREDENEGGRGETKMRVLREEAWVEVTAKALLPGDIVEIPGDESGVGRENETQRQGRAGGRVGGRGRRREVPADMLVLDGQVVVDEAILTGESLPQLKTPPAVGKSPGGGEERLDMGHAHQLHVLYSGTAVLRIEGPRILARVLRTGYYSTQGELLRVVGSQQEQARLDADSPDTLVMFAGLGTLSLVAAGGVLWQGHRDIKGGGDGGAKGGGGDQAGWLLLRAARLVARGMPFWLLDMLNDTVAGAVLALARGPAQMLCTEPFRIPLAGNVDTCVFDKTGTLTSEHLTLQGIFLPPGRPPDPACENERRDKPPSSSPSSPSTITPAVLLSPPTATPLRTQHVLVACHSLIDVEGELRGDSLELSALRGCGKAWSFDGRKGVLSRAKEGGKEGGREGGREVLVIEKRFPFSASLQRMSVVVRVEPVCPSLVPEDGQDTKGASPKPRPRQKEQRPNKKKKKDVMITQAGVKVLQEKEGHNEVDDAGAGKEEEQVERKGMEESRRVVLVKGSPEAMKPLFLPSSLPPSYEQAFHSLASQGARVLALGYKDLEGGQEGGREGGREDVEEGLVFAGLAAFRTPVRADTSKVIQELKNAGMDLCVLSGDSLLTSMAVAREVGILQGKEGGRKGTLVLEWEGIAGVEEGREGNDDFRKGRKARGKKGKKKKPKSRLAWFLAPDLAPSSPGAKTGSIPPGLLQKKLRRYMAFDPRTIPRLALKYDLCGGGKALAEAWKEDEAGETLGRYLHCFRVLARATPDMKEQVVKMMRRDGKRKVLMCGDGANDVGALKAADCGVALLTGFGEMNTKQGGREGSQGKGHMGGKKQATVSAAAVKKRENSRRKQAQEKFQKVLKEALARAQIKEKPTTAWAYLRMFYRAYKQASQEVFGAPGVAGAAARGAWRWDGGEEGVEDNQGLNLKLGDASLAAPFTSKNPSIMCVPELIRQGRASLARVQQQSQQGLSFSLANLLYHFTLAARGARMGRRQLVVTGLLGSVLEVGMRNIVPLPGIEPVRLPQSVLHPSSLLSVVGQCLLQTWLTYGLLQVAEGGERKVVGEGEGEGEGERKGGKEGMADPAGSLMFLSQLVETAVGCVVSVKGYPFSTGIFESPSLVFALVGLLLLPVWIALEVDVDGCNRRLQVGKWGEEEGGEEDGKRRRAIASNLLLQFFLPVAWDTAMLYIFAPEVGKARWRKRGTDGGLEGGKNIGTALLAWALILGNIVPWEGLVAKLSMDPAEMMMEMALGGEEHGTEEEEGGEEAREGKEDDIAT
jgi:cation-transporting ATPase 13A1